MKRLLLVCLGVLFVAMCLLHTQRSRGQALTAVYGDAGLKQLTFEGATLEDTSRFAGDGFHIGHLKVTDLQGKVLPGQQFGWGEANSGRKWDGAAHQWTYQFVWGTIEVQYLCSGSRLDVKVTEKNFANSNVILDGAVIYPLVLHFPQLPAGFQDAKNVQLTPTTTSPGVTAADYGSGEVVAVATEATKPLYSGFWPSGDANAYSVMVASTTPDSLPTFQPRIDRPVLPGQTDTFVVSLRFAPAGTAPTVLAGDAYASFAQTFRSQLSWKDRRPVGTVYLASAPQSSAGSAAAGSLSNPRRYFNNAGLGDFDVRTAAGLRAFQQRLLQQAQTIVANLNALGAQGAVVWDMEGEQYPHATTYLCSPEQIGQVAPEMESVVADPASHYRGYKLDDAFFKTITDAGFRVGVCVRPQHLQLAADGTARQEVLTGEEVKAELQRKIAFAHDRWGARLFYVDSNVDASGGVLDASMFQELQQRFPDSLLMPEASTPRYYAYTAPLRSFLFHGETGTEEGIRAAYPDAFSSVLINDVSASTLSNAIPKLSQSVKSGDLLMGHVDYADPNNKIITALESGVDRKGAPASRSKDASTSSPSAQVHAR